MEKKNPNVYQRALNIINSRINPDISQGDGGGSSGGGMSYDVIVTSTDGGVTFTVYSGSYETAKNKILNKECVTASLYLGATADAPIQIYRNFSVIYSEETETIVINFLYLSGSFLQLTLSKDGTVIKKS